MYCSNCGKKLSPDDYFCSNCGTPVLRQGLFDDDDTNDDAFEETRLFTAEELGKYLNDDETLARERESAEISSDEVPAAALEDEKTVKKEKSVTSGAAAKAAVAGVASTAGMFADKFKGKLATMKDKQKEKKEAHSKQIVTEEKSIAQAQADNVAQAPDESSMTKSTNTKAQDAEPVSAKKIVLPVIVLGLIIGLVIGLVLIQPWSGGDDTTTDEATTTGIIMME